ncbi:MAG: EF2563 family selenium-dependent molybdenum hydroxylase system protein [Tissierellales bacterium]|nr:EF2563 family selenium-dependent molybdenum hydroxylase system protein [Tissierellales bacterium]
MQIVIVRGAGDIASGIIHRLFKSGFKVIALEIEKPLSIRRTVSFSEAIYDGETTVEGVKAVFADNVKTALSILEDGNVPVIIDEEGLSISQIKPMAVVDAILAKKNLGTNRNQAPITIGVGPGFCAGEDVDYVIETKRGHYLGKVIYKGSAIPNTGIPGLINGYGEERVIKSPCDGLIRHERNIGDLVKEDDIICYVGDLKVKSPIKGVIRGLIRENLFVTKSMKIADIDPRGEIDYVYTISDKARAVAGGVLEAILNGLSKGGYYGY